MLNKTKTYKFVYMCIIFQVPGGLKTFILCIGLPATIYTPKVHRLWQGLSRRAAVEKRPTAKATPIPVHVIQKVIEKIHNAYSSYWDVPIPMFRACLAVILQYHTLCRLSDMEDLRACHFQKDEYKGSTYIKVTFPKAKNDQNWSGRASIIASESGLTCPVYIIERFFDRCGYLFFDGQNLDSNYIFCRSSTVNIGHSHQTVSDGMRKLSINTLLSDVKRLCLSVGYSGPIGRKSVKMSGVAAGFAAGLSDEALRDKGRWASIDTSAIYRTHTLDYQHALAAATNLSNATSSAAASRVPRLHVFRDCVTARPFHPRRDASDSTAFNNVVQDFRRQDRFRQPAAPIRVPNRPHVFHNIAVSPLFSSNNKSRSYANKGADATNVIHVTKAFESINCYSESEED